MRMLITGADGFLGKKLVSIMQKEHDVFGISRRNGRDKIFLGDISEKSSIERVMKSVNPKILIHSAALVDVEKCEIDKETAYKENAEATKNIALICQKEGIKLIFFSSDYVFDGNSEGVYETYSKANPINYYGITKKDGETFVSELVKDYLIIRLTMLYGFNNFWDPKNFVMDVVKKLENGETVEMDNRRRKYPLLIDDVAYKTIRLMNRDALGAIHMSGPDETTKFQFGKMIARTFSLDERLIIENNSDEANKPYKIRFSNESSNGMHNITNGLKIIKSQMGGYWNN